MRFNAIALQTAALAVALLSTGAARADSTPLGLWIDHTGRGAVEIVDCNGRMCGYVAWVKDAKDADGCGEQIIGDVKSIGDGKWDQGWIYDPDSSSKYDVELTPAGDQMKVMGYAGTKWLSETYTWKRAPADLKKCTKPGASADAPAAKPESDAAPAAPAVKKVADVAPAAPKQTAVVAPVTPVTEKVVDAAPEVAEAPPPATVAADEAPKTKKAKKKDGPNAATMVARIVDAMNDDNQGGKTRTLGKGGCKMEVPYLEMVVSYPCDN